ncbi:hypothetical protein ON010_g202 [Phytophthora cinnamomi]|nr:hypothetical protein ON010_g202 [Phytophthora cinnamomi]
MPAGEKRDAGDPAVVARSLQAKGKKTSTKRTYQSKVKTMTEWLMAHYPDTIDNTTRHMRVPLPTYAVLAFFGHLCESAHVCDRDGVSAQTTASVPLSASCIWGYRSAIVDVYRANFLKLEPRLDTELRRVLEDYEKTINSLKQRGLMQINEGELPLKSSGFEIVVSKLMALKPVTKGQTWYTMWFGWSFLVLMWNLMSRTDSVDKIMLQHMEWNEGGLIIEEQGDKGDHTGEERYGKRIYANPFDPFKCPILALAVHLFCCPERGIGGKQQLFSDSKYRFGRLLGRVIKSFDEEELRVRGCIPEDIGIHSLHKGSSSYALGQVNGPTHVSICLRMGQSLGKLKDRYIHFGDGADQLCGRMISGLRINSEHFGVLPPHFHPELLANKSIEYWKEIVSGYSNYPRGVQSAFKFLLASIIHHEPYLRDTLCSQHPIFTGKMFSANRLLYQQRGAVILAIGTSQVCGLKATGISAHLAVAKQVNDLRYEVASLHSEIDDLKNVKLETLLDEVAEKVCEALRQHFVINGMAPVSLSDLDRRINELRASIIIEFRMVQQDNYSTPSNAPGEYQTDWRAWSWEDGKICHAVSEGWGFAARANVKTVWNLWFFGDKDTQIRPYRLLNKQHDIMPAHRMRHSRVSKVMAHMEQLAAEVNVLPSGITSISALHIPMADTVFDVVFAAMLSKLFATRPKRAEELSCDTIYNRLCRFRE